MSKEKMLDKQLNVLNAYLATLLAVLVGLVGFIFSSLGGIIKCENWLIYLSLIALFLTFFGLYFLQKFINKKFR